MASSAYGRKLNPYRRLRDPLGVKGVRQSVVVTNNPSSIDQNQQLLVRFPNLGAHDVVVPGTARLAFTVSLTSTDANRTIVKNIGRAVVKKTTIKISGNEVLSIDDSDVLHCYQDLWKTARKGVIPSTRALTYRMTAMSPGSASGLEIRMRPKLKTLRSRLPTATDTTYHSISNCSRATCPSISQPWETALSTNSPSTTTPA